MKRYKHAKMCDFSFSMQEKDSQNFSCFIQKLHFFFSQMLWHKNLKSKLHFDGRDSGKFHWNLLIYCNLWWHEMDIQCSWKQCIRKLNTGNKVKFNRCYHIFPQYMIAYRDSRGIQIRYTLLTITIRNEKWKGN